MCETSKTIKLTKDQAIALHLSNPEFRTTILSVFTDEELGIGPNWPKRWENCRNVSGAWVHQESELRYTKAASIDRRNLCVYKTEKQAQSALAFAQLSQLVAEMNGDWKADWSKHNMQKKYGVYRHEDEVRRCDYIGQYSPLVFKDREMAAFSLKHHNDLWKQYYQLD